MDEASQDHIILSLSDPAVTFKDLTNQLLQINDGSQTSLTYPFIFIKACISWDLEQGQVRDDEKYYSHHLVPFLPLYPVLCSFIHSNRV